MRWFIYVAVIWLKGLLDLDSVCRLRAVSAQEDESDQVE